MALPSEPRRRYATLADRVLARITPADPDDPGSCWLFFGNLDHKGYACITQRRAKGKSPTRVRAHRVLWEWFHGKKLRRDLTLDHRPTCPRCCCNPMHVEPVTRATNTWRMMWWRAERDRIS